MLFSLVLLFSDPSGATQAATVDHALTLEDCAAQARDDVRSIAIGGAEFHFPAHAARLVCEGE